MYEGQTFETILERMLNRVTNNVDKRQGSIIFDALAPAAVMFAQYYIDLEINLDLVMPDTATDEYLDRVAVELDVVRKPAQKAIRAGQFYDSGNGPIDIPIGSRFSIDDVDFTAISKTGPGTYKLECETAGEIGNTIAGQLIPIDYIPGLATAVLGAVLVAGSDAEDDESLRARYFDRAQKPITSGNKYHYEYWAKQVQGIGDARAIPVWNGPNTVKVVLITDNKRSPAPEKIAEADSYIRSVMPIGVDLTVAGVRELAIDLSGALTLETGVNVSVVLGAVSDGLDDYLKSIALKEAVIRYSKIANIILDADGVIDYANLTVNGGTSNIVLDPDQIGIVGTVDLS
ncbi:baseplate J/gp47 family protein [Paenibacillus vini]|uniref:Baseplate J protein n=1 Tax=Paenibacillus vini TaxID=1476024 RepID=A0ABQ4MIZ8_9BACL|nr:baseplate J/gp47 family protein [Paenibacillus vini]GIP55968.1 hypothetical protein J42TS3_50030 [Paenibacillus vini]